MPRRRPPNIDEFANLIRLREALRALVDTADADSIERFRDALEPIRRVFWPALPAALRADLTALADADGSASQGPAADRLRATAARALAGLPGGRPDGPEL